MFQLRKVREFDSFQELRAHQRIWLFTTDQIKFASWINVTEFCTVPVFYWNNLNPALPYIYVGLLIVSFFTEFFGAFLRVLVRYRLHLLISDHP